MTEPLDDASTHWLPAGGYLLRLAGDAIIAADADGQPLPAVPAAATTHEVYEQLDARRAFLAHHAAACRDVVRGWFSVGAVVPVSVLTAVWPDDAWQDVLTDLVLTDGVVTGLLRHADPVALYLMGLDRESVRITRTDAAAVRIPHPITLTRLDDWRELAVELGIDQSVDQLWREITHKPAGAQAQSTALNAYRHARYERAGHLIGRARSAGFTATLSTVSTQVTEAGRRVTAELGVHAYLPDEDATLGELSFHTDHTPLNPADVGPIAWSEAIRMADYLWAGRTHKDN